MGEARPSRRSNHGVLAGGTRGVFGVARTGGILADRAQYVLPRLRPLVCAHGRRPTGMAVAREPQVTVCYLLDGLNARFSPRLSHLVTVCYLDLLGRTKRPAAAFSAIVRSSPFKRPVSCYATGRG